MFFRLIENALFLINLGLKSVGSLYENKIKGKKPALISQFLFDLYQFRFPKKDKNIINASVAKTAAKAAYYKVWLAHLSASFTFNVSFLGRDDLFSLSLTQASAPVTRIRISTGSVDKSEQGL